MQTLRMCDIVSCARKEVHKEIEDWEVKHRIL